MRTHTGGRAYATERGIHELLVDTGVLFTSTRAKSPASPTRVKYVAWHEDTNTVVVRTIYSSRMRTHM